MGIDPGAANLGFGIVRVEGNHMVALDGGVVETPAELDMADRLHRIHRALPGGYRWGSPVLGVWNELHGGHNYPACDG